MRRFIMKKEKKIKEKKQDKKKLEEKLESPIEKENEPKEPNKVVASFNMYKFIIKILAAVLLLALAIILVVEINSAMFLLFLVTGAVSALAGVIRLIFVAKSGRCKESKRITIVETLIHILLGGYLVAAAFLYKEDPSSKISVFNDNYYGLFLAAILYVKAVAYFWQTVIYKENTTRFMFWLHIIFVTISVLFAAFAGDIKGNSIIWALFAVSLACSLVIGGEAGGGYLRYRRALSPKKEKAKEDKPAKEAPAVDEDKIIDEIDPTIIPENDNNQDSSIVS